MASTRFGKGYSRVWQVVCYTLSPHLMSMRQKGFGAWGIQSRPFAVHSALFVKKFFHALCFHTRRPILISWEGQYGGRRILATPKEEKTRQRDLVHGAFNMVHLVLRRSHLFDCHTGKPIVLTSISGSGRGFVCLSHLICTFCNTFTLFLILAWRGCKNVAG